ncbi:serine carboxypeptidase [Epithele typhae]|uniref:serine carboxypeptidase n=1 Tax=Epithele typhae TaxID=378194 RepID=UPI002008785F|nr:serine carboxypeptidase [Epithele typhae]KAH9927150.1 serine carboxypeptidase [Epithele typhae]
MGLIVRAVGLLALAIAPVLGLSQFPLSSEQYDAGLFTPYEDLHALSALEYTTLRHPGFPAHSVRIKESRICDGEVRSYSGYIDIEARHLFFMFFESRNDPATDDVMFWTNGGPGGSSALGLYMELGPCRVTGPNSTERFEYAWNDRANVFFIDQPVGVGFSYADFGEQVSTTPEAAKDVAAFVAIFFEHFSQFKDRPFHMAGESYGGRYIPLFAAAVYDQNAKLVEAGMAPINLTSVMIGNGCTDELGMMEAYYDAQCGDYGFPRVTDISDCIRMKQIVSRCKKRLQESCKDIYDAISSTSTKLFSAVNPYDALRPCKEDADMRKCYPEVDFIESYLNIPAVKEAIGVDVHRNYTAINLELNARFFMAGDHVNYVAEDYLAALLERGVPALIYVGATDWICNWIGIGRMTLDLEWTGQESFRSSPLRDWFVDDEVAGTTRSNGKLTFATIDGAGHMVPLDQPERGLALINRWLASRPL